MTDWDDDILSEDAIDETIIELVDIVERGPGLETEEDVIELTDIVKEEGDDLDLDIADMENDVAGQGVALPVETAGRTDEPQEIELSAQQIEAALERVIEKKFADKIEAILFEVMEKVIEKEIAEIKESLQKDLDQIGNV